MTVTSIWLLMMKIFVSPFSATAKGEEGFVSLLEEGIREVTVFLFPSSPLTESDTCQSHPPLSPFKGGGKAYFPA